MAISINPEFLKELLSKELAGSDAQMLMAPLNRINIREQRECRNAAVMLLLYPDGNVVRIVFIKRNEYNGHHSGQISFPGGMQEEGEDDLTVTALRETEEEIGVDRRSIELLGKLTPLIIPVSNICVSPFVGWIHEKPRFIAQPSEVQYLITPEIDELLNRVNHSHGLLEGDNYRIETPYIKLGEEILWGATAMMLNEFIVMLERQ